MMDPQKVLVVEDEAEIRELMSLHLIRQGFLVQQCSTGEEALTLINKGRYSLVVLDWMLPGCSGVDVVQNMKINGVQASVLMVTAKAEAQDIVKGLESGADDFLTKPFEPSVFMARIRALLRRNSLVNESQNLNQKNKKNLELLGLLINLDAHEAFMHSQKLHLTPSEFKLLACMLSNQGKVLTRDQLIEEIQGEGVNVIGRTVDTHVFALRKKLGDWSENIETIRGIGYRVKVEEKPL